MLSCIETFKEEKVTSDFLAGSVNVNPVVIRRILQQLKAEGIQYVLVNGQIAVDNGKETGIRARRMLKRKK